MLRSRCTGSSNFNSVIENTDGQFYDCYEPLIIQRFSPFNVIDSICYIGHINVQINIFYILFMSL